MYKVFIILSLPFEEKCMWKSHYPAIFCCWIVMSLSEFSQTILQADNSNILHQFYKENEANKDDKVQAAKTPDSRSLFIFKIYVAKNRSGSREGFFSTVNLVFSLSKQYRMEESLPIAEGHNPTTNEIPKVFPSILSPHLLHSAAPCHALLPQQDTATSTGLSGQVCEGIFRHKDEQPPSHSEATGKMLHCQEEHFNSMVRIWFRMKTLNLKWDDPI